MKYEQLAEFIESQMSMSHIYQPVLIKTLVEAGGSATVRQIATAFATSDEAVLQEAERTIRKMPLPVLEKRGVIQYDGTSGVVRLGTPPLTLEQRAYLKAACEQKVSDYLAKRGMGLWDYRLIDDTAVPGSVRYQVLADGDFRCALCGATDKERPLDVDHIIPRSRKGSNDKSNLQILCSKCNRAKGNKDDRDFRVRPPERDPGCPFCAEGFYDRAIEENPSALAVQDLFPVTKGHTLIVPKRHTPDQLALTQVEREDVDSLLRLLVKRLEADDPRVAGFNIGSNAGEAAGQTVRHAHIHLIPRRKGDVPAPAGGVRAVIPAKQAPE
jgi:ATP adenylyltransferase